MINGGSQCYRFWSMYEYSFLTKVDNKEPYCSKVYSVRKWFVYKHLSLLTVQINCVIIM